MRLSFIWICLTKSGLFHNVKLKVFFFIVCLGLVAINSKTLIADETKSSTKVYLPEALKYQPSLPKKRGDNYTSLPGNPEWLEKFAIILGWRIELNDDSGLTFGGLSIRTEDPRSPTMVKKEGQWVPINEELIRKNKLQELSNKILELRKPLKHITSLARHIYLEGVDENAEKVYYEKEIAPKVSDLANKIKVISDNLTKAKFEDAYLTGQVSYATSLFSQILPVVMAIGAKGNHANFLALRQARINLESAYEALDAIPPARVLSMMAYDEKTKLYVLESPKF